MFIGALSYSFAKPNISLPAKEKPFQNGVYS